VTDNSKELQRLLEQRQKRLQEQPVSKEEIEAEERRIRGTFLGELLGDPSLLGWQTVRNPLFDKENRSNG
jgi:hypothetical protein